MTDSKDLAESLFLNALEIATEGERAAYVAAQCGADPELRQEVEELLDHAQRLGPFLEPGEEAVDGTTAHPISERTGTVIGPYKLLQQIGEGGMGVVFLAEQTRPVQRTVALKIIKPGMDTRKVIARFEAERQALALMDHPNIARVLDVGATDAGRPYFVMDLVKGVPITDYCDHEHLPVRQRLELFTQVCHAVQHAHQKGIIHRDLKPSNVLVAEYDGKPVPKIIDFGVAKATASKLTEKTMFTELGQLVGTVEYMSPEQARFNQLDVDTRSDIYSLGVLLYELLTGSTPFGRKRLNDAAFDEMLRIIREEEPPKPSTRLSSCETLPSIAANRGLEPLKLNRLLQGELDWIVMKALDKDRDRRYETASSLAADIQRHLNDEAVQASPPSAAYRFRKFARRNKPALLTGTLIAAALVLGTLVSTWQAVRATRAEGIAIQERQIAKDAAVIADQQKELALRQRDLTLNNLYVASMPRAYQDWKQGNVRRMWETLATFLPREGLADLRGWEWYYLASLLEEDENVLRPEIGSIGGVSWSPDGHLLAVAGERGVKVYEPVSKQLVRTLPGTSPIAWHPQNSFLATVTKGGASTPREVTIWNVETGKPLKRIEGSPGWTSGMAWRPDGGALAWAGDLTFDIWLDGEDTAEHHTYQKSPIKSMLGVTGEQEIELRAAFERENVAVQSITALDWSSDGRQLIIATESPSRIVIWNAVRRVVNEEFGVYSGWGFNATKRNPVNGKFAFSARTGRIYIADINDRNSFWETKLHRGRAHGVAWSPDGHRLVSGGDDNLVRIWDTRTGEQVRYFAGHQQSVRAVDWSPAGTLIASASSDGAVRIWRPDQNQVALTLPAHQTLAWSPDGKKLVTSFRGPDVILDARTGEQLQALKPAPFERLMALAWSPDGNYIGGAFLNNAACIWDAHSGKVVHQLPNITDGECRCVAWSPDSRLFATSGHGGVKIWATSTGELVSQLVGPHRVVGSIRWSPDGQWFAAAGVDRHVTIWNPVTWELISEMRNDPGQAIFDGTYAIAWSPDSRRLATRTGDGGLVVWELRSGHQPQAMWTVRAHTSNIRSISWSPDGRRIASASEDSLVKLWDAATGRELLTLDEHAQMVMAVAWSADGSRLASAGALSGLGGDTFIRDASRALAVDWTERQLAPQEPEQGNQESLPGTDN